MSDIREIVPGMRTSNLLNCSFVLLFSFFVSAPPLRAETPAAFKVGCILYLTGDLAMQENAFREGIEIAQDEVNDLGGVRGQPLQVIVEDTGNDPKRGVTATKKFLTIDKVHAALISSYQDAMTSGPLYEQAKIPAVTLWDAAPEIDSVGNYVFSIGPWIPSAGETAADFVFSRLNAKSVVTVNTVEHWSQTVKGYFAKRFSAQGGEIRLSLEAPPDLMDFGTIVSKLRAANADALYAPLTYNILPFHKRLREAGWNKPVVTSDIVTEEMVKQSPETFEGVFQTGVGDPSTREYSSLSNRYKQKFKKDITMPWFVATGYDALKLVARAAEVHGETGLQIRSGLEQTVDYRGAARTYTFNDQGTAAEMERMFRIKGATFVPVP